jgi:hypothetical protein
MSLNLFSKLCLLFSILAISPFLSSQAQQAQKSIEPARQLDPVRSLFAQSNVGGKETQDQIDVIDDTTNGIVQEFRQNYQQLKDLTIYNDQLEILIDRQERKMDRVEQDIARISSLTRSVMPLMFKMIDALDTFVELDTPFLIDERRTRVANLRNLMNNPEASPAEKYRKIAEAYEIENEYGRTIEAYTGKISADQDRTVNFLRIGRNSYVYQTLDGDEQAVWSQSRGEWKGLSGSYRLPIQVGIRIANEQAAPDLMVIPLEISAE